MERALEIKPSMARLRALAAREQKNRTARRMLALPNAPKGKSRAPESGAAGLDLHALRDAVVRYNAYRANIVTYSMAKLAHDMDERDKLVDLDRIWRQQAVPEPVEDALLLAAAEAHYVITHPPEGVRNMSEWAKKQACWAQFQQRELDYSTKLKDYLLSPAEAASAVDAERKKKAVTSDIETQSTVVNLGAAFWKDALEWGKAHRLVTPKEVGVLETCSRIPDRLPSEKQCIIAVEVLERLETDGFEARASEDGE